MAASEAGVVSSSSLKTDTSPVLETAGRVAAMAATPPARAAATVVAAAARTGSEARVSKAALATKLLSLSGVFAVHKPKGPTSAELLNRLKEKLLAEAGMPCPEWTKRKKQTLKIGHGGTLDSAARGVLVVGIGSGTKMLTSMLSGSKRYTAIGELGKATDTLDSTGKVTEEKPYDVECGGGFYIRSLVSDIGKELSSCANVLELTRTKQGPFTLEEHALPEDKWTIDDIAQSLEHCSSLFPAELALKKSKPESNEQVLSCEYITLNEPKGEDDVIKTC
ncbi:pseudouridylate synthase TRUB1 isoform X2 [Symphalangus syndactylus]|uniref:pseudouridylate synthase TRUB1 isoform X2 n=1 Tax=Symphalangus syndactylus TaxID=9590 RepID=UPI002441A5A3|nr:pseudouridylate synthase TRUB1 isoform X2 [Symphalangus syndactylus]